MKKLILLLVLACMLAACAPAPAAQPTLTPRPVVQGYRDFPSTMEGNGIALVPGLYKFPSWYPTRLAIEFKEEGWKVITLERSELLAFVQGENEVGYADKWVIFLPVYGTETSDLLDDMVESDRLTLLAGPEQRTIGSSLAAMAVFQALPNPDFAATDEYVAGVQELDMIQNYSGNWIWLTSSPEARIQYISMSVGGEPVAVYIEAPQDEFEAFVVEALDLIAQVKPQ